MVSNVMIGRLRCPSTGQRLAVAPAGLLAALEAERAAGRLINQAGKAVEECLTEGLIREDRQVFYPVSEGIPVMLVEESIRVPD